MNRQFKTEIIRNTSLTNEANVITCNYSNALNIFRGNSFIISERIKTQEFKHFLKLKNKWKSETMFYSSSTTIFNNSSYKEIINFGEKSVPWIIRELKRTDDHWFYALKTITGINPVNPENYGIISQMKKDWIDWAEQNNY